MGHEVCQHRRTEIVDLHSRVLLASKHPRYGVGNTSKDGICKGRCIATFSFLA